MIQPCLPFVRRLQTTAGDASRIVERALAAGGWMTARELADCTWLDDRAIRRAAESSCGGILSGQRGYRLAERASAEEIHHAAAWLESQAKQMLARAVEIRRRAHGRIG